MSKTKEHILEMLENDMYRALSSYIRETNISSVDLVKQSGVSWHVIQKILKGNLNCSVENFIKLSLAIGIEPKISLVNQKL